MAIRLRYVNGLLVALCAARSVAKPGDVYLDDAEHAALAAKFARDWNSTGHKTPYASDPEVEALVDEEESDNENRAEWDRTFGVDVVSS